MMKKLAIIITATILSISISAQDPHWNTDGNTGTNPNDDFVGTIDDADLRFRTDDEERMTLTGDDGWLGLGTNNPTRKFHLHEATPNLAQASRLCLPCSPNKSSVKYS